MPADADSVGAAEPDREALGKDLQRRYGITLSDLREMYEQWADHGVPKSVIEARYLRTRRFHGKLFSRLVSKYLGIETQHDHPLRVRADELSLEVERLRKMLVDLGVDPDADGLNSGDL